MGFISPLAYKESQYGFSEKLDRIAVGNFGRASLNRAYQRVFSDFRGFRYDIRTGSRVFDSQPVSERRNQSYTESFELALAERKPLLETDIIEQGLAHLEEFLAEAKARNVDVVLFTTPVKNSLFDQLSQHGFDQSIAQWKLSLKERGEFVDLFYRLSDEQQGMFWDPTHLLQSHSDFVFRHVFIEEHLE